MSLPDLTATITAKTDGFESSLSRAAKASEDTARRVEAATDQIGGAFSILKGLGEGALAALTVNAFVGLIKGSIDAADHLNDLSKKTGVAVETLGGFGFAAEQAGGTLDSMASGLGKLNLSLSAAAGGNARAREAFDLLGVSVKNVDGTTKSAAQAFPELAAKFASFNDGPDKAALAVRIFGKAGAEMIAMLDDGGAKLLENVEYFKKYSGVTQELAEKADEFNDTLTKLGLLSGSFGKQLAGELLPGLQAVAESLLDAKEKGTALATVAGAIGTAFDALLIGLAEVGTELYKSGIAFVAFGDKIDSFFNRAREPRSISQISDALAVDTAKADATLDSFRKRLSANRNTTDNPFGKIDFGQKDVDFDGKSTKKDAPRLNGSGKKGAAVDDPTKKQLDQDLKALELYVAAQKQLLSESDAFLSTFYQRGEVSLGDFYGRRQSLRETDLANTRSAYAEEIADLQKYIASISASDPKAESKRVEASTKLIDVNAKLARAEHDAAINAAKDMLARQTAVEQYRDALNGIAGQVASIAGNSVVGAASGFDGQNRNRTRALQSTVASSTSSNDERAEAQAGLDNLAQLRQETVLRAALNDQEQRRSTILLELQNVTDRVNNAVSSGRRTELEGLADLSTANRARIEDLQKVIDAQQKLAESSQDPQALARVDALRVQLERLASQTDLVADKFRSIGEAATENFIDKLASGTGTVRDAFKSLVSDINKELLKVGEMEISQQLFKKDGVIGSAITSLLGNADPNSAGSKAAAAITDKLGGAAGSLGSGGSNVALTTFSTSVSAANAPLIELATVSSAAAQAVAQLAASSGGSNVGGLLSSVGSSGGGDALAESGLLDILASAKGNVFNAGNVVPFAIGGIVNRPTMFPMRNGSAGLMGEAGPEAIIPLRRGKGGKLGVALHDSGNSGPSTTIINNINVPAPANRDLSTARQHGEALRRALS